MLKTYRRIARLTQEGLATKAGVDPAVISRIENGKPLSSSHFDTVVRIARALNLSPEELCPVPPIAESTMEAQP